MSTEEVAVNIALSQSADASLEKGLQKASQPTDIALPPVGVEIVADLENQARKFLQNIGSMPVNSPAFEAYMKRIENLGHDELSSVGGGSKRLIERNVATLGDNRRGGTSNEVVEQALDRLNGLVKELAPTDHNLSPRNFFGFKKRNSLNVYFDKYNEAQESINDVVKVLLEGKDLIIRDNAMLEQEKQELLILLNSLQEYLELVNILERETLQEIEKQRQTGAKDEEEITRFETVIIFAIRQKKQDILSRMVVGEQAYLAMTLIRDNNKQLHKSIDNARATTVTALRTAILVSQSLSNQKNLLDGFETIMREAEVSVRRASKDTSREVNNLRSPNVNTEQVVDELTRVFDRVKGAIDMLTATKEAADSQTEESITELNKELQHSVERIEENLENQKKHAEEDNK